MICSDVSTAGLITSPRSKNVLIRLFERIMDLFKRIFCRAELPTSSESLQGRVEVVQQEKEQPIYAEPEAREEAVLFSFEAPKGLTAAELLERRMEATGVVFQGSLPRQEVSEAPRPFSALELLNLRMGLPLDTPLF